MRLKNLEVAVEVADGPLKEYSVSQESDSVVNCYVPSSKGQAFKLVLRNSSVEHIYRIQCFIDGRLARNKVVHERKSRSLRGVRSSPTVLRLFVFSELQLVEDELPASGSVNMDALGTIEFRACRVKFGSVKPGGGTDLHVDEIGPVNERSKKAGTHCVAFGEGVTVQESDTHKSYRYIDPKDRPYMIFRFRYRPKEVLQAQGIMPLDIPREVPFQGPQPPSSSDANKPKKRPHGSRPGNGSSSSNAEAGPSSKRVKVKAEQGGSDSSSDVEILLNQLDIMAAQMSAIRAKMEKKREKKRPEQPPLKKEPSPIKIGTNGGVIDLTSD